MTHGAARAALTETDRQCGWTFHEILMCAHHPGNDAVGASCFCRKPRPGLAFEYMASRPGRAFRADQTLVVGDRDDDSRLASALGVDFLGAELWRNRQYPARFQHLLPAALP